MRTARKAETVSGTVFTDMCETGEIITFDKLLWSQNQSVNMRIIESSKMILTWRKIWKAGPTPGLKIWGFWKKIDQSWRFLSKNGTKSPPSKEKVV